MAPDPEASVPVQQSDRALSSETGAKPSKQDPPVDWRARSQGLENALRKQLHEKLDELHLHDDTGDPHDEGYMRALTDVREIVAALGLPDEEGED